MHRDRRTVAWLTLALLGCEAAPRTLEDRLETPIDGFANPALLHGVTGDGRSSFLSASVRGSVTELVRVDTHSGDLVALGDCADGGTVARLRSGVAYQSSGPDCGAAPEGVVIDLRPRGRR